MKKFLALLVVVGGILLASSGCQSENAQYEPTPDKVPKIPNENPRAGDAETFLPQQE